MTKYLIDLISKREQHFFIVKIFTSINYFPIYLLHVSA